MRNMLAIRYSFPVVIVFAFTHWFPLGSMRMILGLLCACTAPCLPLRNALLMSPLQFFFCGQPILKALAIFATAL